MMRPGRHLSLPVVVTACFLLLSCSAARDVVTERIIRLPRVQIVSADITRLSFTDADLLFDVKVTNSNPIGIIMEGFEYDFLIEGEPFIRGKQHGRVQIEANDSSIVPFPLSLGYSSVYRTVALLRDRESAEYTLRLTLFFEVPVLGVVEVPVEHKGEFPLLRLPAIAPYAVRVERIGLTSADLLLEIGVENPNTFSFEASLFRYELIINERKWVSGSMREIVVQAKQKSVHEIPINIDFVEMGESVIRLLSTGERAVYTLRGKVGLVTSFPLLGEVELPFEVSGEIPIIK
jgi:LEA14-like dessication related protein